MNILEGVLGVDLETSSERPIGVGAWAYSLHPSTICLCACFVYSTGRDAERVEFEWEPGDVLPKPVRDFIVNGGQLLAHNNSFEHAIWTNVLLPQGFPQVDDSQWQDTQPVGMAMNLPASLDGLTHSLGCPMQKDHEGQKLMLKMCKATPNEQGGWDYPLADDRAARKRLRQYCMSDVHAMLDAHWRMPKLSMTEARVWMVDQRINKRGMYLDQEFAASCAIVAEQRKAELDNEAFSLTAGALVNSREPRALKQWLRECDVQVPTKVTRKKQPDGTFKAAKSETTDKAAVVKLLADPKLRAEVRAILQNRQESNKVSSLSKLKRIGVMVGPDGRLRNALAYCGAHTGRWASYGLQVHNLAKDKMGPGEGSLVRLALRRRDLNLLKQATALPLAAVSQSIRSCVSAPEGRELIAADFSAVEARVLAWLADQEDLLAIFHSGQDVYVHAATSIGSRDRQLGKTCVLGLGYGMGAAKFVDTCATNGIDIEPKRAWQVHRLWRKANTEIVAFWRVLEQAVRDAIENPGTLFTAGRHIRVHSTPNCLLITLPSGRKLRYWRPKIVLTTKTIKMLQEDGSTIEKEMKSHEIRYFTPRGGVMAPESTYGGKLVENVTQAVARDLLAEAIIRIDDTDPYDVVIHVHDSCGAEVPKGEGDVDEFCRLMAQLPQWAAGCPIDAEGYRSDRFQG
jgi:DNA polymerase